MELDNRYVSFICAWNNRSVLEKYFLSSVPALKKDEVLLIHKANSMAKAYYDAEHKARHNILVFAHQDVLFPVGWRKQLEKQIHIIESLDSSWGLIGAVGGMPRKIQFGKYALFPVGSIRDPNHVYEHLLDEPLPCRAGWMDACLAVKKKGRPYFDLSLPGWHGIVEDLCYAMHKAGRGIWIGDLYVEHWCGNGTNTNLQTLWDNANRLREKWKTPFFAGSRLFI